MANEQTIQTAQAEKPQMFEPPVQSSAVPEPDQYPEEHEEPRHEISDEDRDEHVAALRQIAQNIRNRNDQDTNRMLDGMAVHLDALDGNPEEREAQRLEAEQAKAREQKRRASVEDKANVV